MQYCTLVNFSIYIDIISNVDANKIFINYTRQKFINSCSNNFYKQNFVNFVNKILVNYCQQTFYKV